GANAAPMKVVPTPSKFADIRIFWWLLMVAASRPIKSARRRRVRRSGLAAGDDEALLRHDKDCREGLVSVQRCRVDHDGVIGRPQRCDRPRRILGVPRADIPLNLRWIDLHPAV